MVTFAQPGEGGGEDQKYRFKLKKWTSMTVQEILATA
jgi:hypothetical protein